MPNLYCNKIPDGMELVTKVPKIGEVLWFCGGWWTAKTEETANYPVLVPKKDNPYGMSFEDAAKGAVGGPREYIDFRLAKTGEEVLSLSRDQANPQSFMTMKMMCDSMVPLLILKPKPEKKLHITVELRLNNSGWKPGMGVRLQDTNKTFGTIYSGRVVAVEEVG